MTAEVAIMNKSGVALAADSAVSISTSAGTKVYSTNKLFMLSKYHPVGVMVYGNSEVMGVPWESIIKNYRRDLRDKSFKLLEDYGTDFLAFLDKNPHLFPEDQQALNVYQMLYGFFSLITTQIDNKVEEVTHKGLKVPAATVEQIIDAAIKWHVDFLAKVPRISTLPTGFEKQIFRKYYDIIRQVIEDVFQELPLSSAALKQLKRIAIGRCIKETSRYGFAEPSGIVIAGFGETEVYPSAVAYQIECVINDRLKYGEYYSSKINNITSASVIPFAQKEMVISFMEGIAPEYKDNIKEYLDTLFDKYPEVLIKRFTHLSASDRAKMLEEMKRDGSNLASDFWDRIDSWAKEFNINPILDSVSVLPIGELAAMAESLVNLTSFKRRVTLVAETVGGPVDVAVISKGDGFIWIKRKHYFEAAANPHFFKNYYR